MTRSLVRGVVLAILAVVAAACQGAVAPSSAASAAPSAPTPSAGASASPAPTAQPSAPPAELLLKVTSEGGFINPVASLNALPLVEVYSDGRILTPAPQDAIAPAPLLATVSIRDVGPAGAAAIKAAIQAAGLDGPASGGPGVPGDSGTDIFSVTIDGQTTETRLSGNGPGVGGPGGPGLGGDGSPDPASAERTAAFELLGRLTDPAQTFGAASAPTSTLAPAGFRVFAAPGAPSADPSISRPPVDWPLATPLASFGTLAQPDRGIAGLRQGAVIGPDAAILAPVLAAATDVTAFESGGSPWTLYVRPLLPDEQGG